MEKGKREKQCRKEGNYMGFSCRNLKNNGERQQDKINKAKAKTVKQ
jgi:hypothetical protein